MSLSPSKNPYPIVKKCLLCIDLKIGWLLKFDKKLQLTPWNVAGVLMYIITEMMIWMFLALFALTNESEFFHRYNLYDFEEYIEDNWYYQMIFGLPTSDGDDYDYDYGREFSEVVVCLKKLIENITGT